MVVRTHRPLVVVAAGMADFAEVADFAAVAAVESMAGIVAVPFVAALPGSGSTDAVSIADHLAGMARDFAGSHAERDFAEGLNCKQGSKQTSIQIVEPEIGYATGR
jgi:hypothetical protein